MNIFKALALTVLVLALAVGLALERRARIELHDEIVSLKSELQQLAEQVAAQHQDQMRLASGVRNRPCSQRSWRTNGRN